MLYIVDNNVVFDTVENKIKYMSQSEIITLLRDGVKITGLAMNDNSIEDYDWREANRIKLKVLSGIDMKIYNNVLCSIHNCNNSTLVLGDFINFVTHRSYFENGYFVLDDRIHFGSDNFRKSPVNCIFDTSKLGLDNLYGLRCLVGDGSTDVFTGTDLRLHYVGLLYMLAYCRDMDKLMASPYAFGVDGFSCYRGIYGYVIKFSDSFTTVGRFSCNLDLGVIVDLTEVSLYKAVDIIISIQNYKGLICQEEYKTFLECCNHCIFNSTFEFGDVEVKFLGDYLLHRFNVLLSKYGNLCWLDYTTGNLVDILYTLIQASTSKNNVELRKFYTLLWYYVTYCKSNRLSNDIGGVEAYFNRR